MAETAVKLFALGAAGFWDSPWNRADLCLVAVSLWAFAPSTALSVRFGLLGAVCVTLRPNSLPSRCCLWIETAGESCPA